MYRFNTSVSFRTFLGQDGNRFDSNTHNMNNNKVVSKNNLPQKYEEEGLLWIPRPLRLDQANDDGTAKKGEFDRVKRYKDLAVAFTGAIDGSLLRKGDGLIRLVYAGDPSQCKYHVTVDGKQVPAFSVCGLWVRKLLASPEECPGILNRLKHIPWITGTDEEKKTTLLGLCDDYANHTLVGMTDPNWRIQVLKLPEHMEKAIGNANIVEYICDAPYPYFHVHDLETAYGSIMMTKSATIQFRRGQWTVVPTIIDNSMTENVVMLEEKGQVYVVECPFRNSKDKVVRTQTMGIRAEQGRRPDNIIDAVVHYASLLLPDDIHSRAREQCKILEQCVHAHKIGTSLFKSLQQKLIRLQPETCATGFGPVDSRIALLYVMLSVLNSPPQFIPNIQASVNGVVNTAKRLLVQAYEDSNPFGIGVRALNELATISLLANHVPEWYPSGQLVRKILRYALRLQHDDSTYNYDTEKSHKLADARIDLGNPCLPAMILRSLRAFSGDMNMLDWYASKWARLERSDVASRQWMVTRAGTRPTVMPFPEHGLDQHVVPNIAYCLPGNPSMTGPQPFRSILKRLFNHVTGINPRRVVVPDTFETDVAWARAAQQQVLRLQHAWQAPDDVPVRSVELSMSKAWFAGSVGSVPLTRGRNQPPLVFTLNPVDLLSIVVTPAPSRGMTPADADDIMNDEPLLESGRQAAEARLEQGVPLAMIPKTDLPRPMLYQARFRKHGSQCSVHVGGQWVPCEDVCHWEEDIPAHEDTVVQTFVRQYQPTSRVDKEKVLKRVLAYFATRSSVIPMAKVDRGGGTMNTSSTTVSPCDGEAFRFLLGLSNVAPMAVQPHPTRPFQFKVKNIAYFLHVRRLLQQVMTEQSVPGPCPFQVSELHDRRQRVLFEHQKDSVARMMHDMEQGMTSFFLYLAVGLGKTLIVLEFLRQSAVCGARHIIYTAPESALGSTVREIVDFGFQVDLITGKQRVAEDIEFARIRGVTVFAKNSSWRSPRAGRVTVVKHDALRRVKQALLDNIENAVFINDEVHRTLNLTQRTAAALELARLSKVCIAFTGTPILNVNGADLLVKWLQSFVHFSINKRNFPVAMNGVVSYRVDTGKKVVNTLVEVPFSSDEQRQEERWLNQGQFQEALGYCYRRTYDVMVEETMRRLDRGVLVVARDRRHQQLLCEALARRPGTRVCCFRGDPKVVLPNVRTKQLLYLTSQAVRDGQEENFNVVVVRMQDCEGYDASHLACLVTSIYPSNLATRLQMFGRINRVVQEADSVENVVVTAGVLTKLHHNYEMAKTVFKCLNSKKVNKKVIQTVLAKRKREDGPSFF